MADQRKIEADEPQRTGKDEEQIRGVADQDRDDEFEDTDDDLDEDEADEEDRDPI